MDEFFEQYISSNSVLWFEEAPQTQSAFQRYRNQQFEGFQPACHTNANKKMIEFLKKSWVAPPLPIGMTEEENYRSLKHRMKERMRRQKHKQFYLALHELLPRGTKSDKNSILETANKEIKELEQYREELSRRNEEIGRILLAWENDEIAVENAEINLKVAYPASGFDSMLEVLRCLRNTGCTATAIQSNFSQHEFAAAVEFETRIRAEDVEKAVQRTLFEAEMRFRHHK